MNPFFSIVIPIYEVEKYLSDCVDSVLKQKFKNVEIILVDDGSPDGCPLICDDYAKKDSRIKVVHKQNGGLSSARNAGIKVANGEYIAFLDSDDFYIHNDFLERVFTRLNETSAECLMLQRTKYNDETKEFIKSKNTYDEDICKIIDYDKLLYTLSERDLLEASAALKFIRTSILKNFNLFFKEGIYSEDVEWAFRLYPILKSGVVLNYPDYAYRLREGSITHSLSKKNIDDVFYSIETYADRIKNDSTDEKVKKSLLNYLAYQYLIEIGLIQVYLPKNLKKEYIKKLSKYKWICKYAISKKTRRASKIVKIFGINVATIILGRYIKMK